MIEKLKVKIIYDDFKNKVHLTSEQERILKMLMEKDTIVKISMTIGVSERTIGYEIRKLKNLFKSYEELEIAKINVLQK